VSIEQFLQIRNAILVPVISLDEGHAFGGLAVVPGVRDVRIRTHAEFGEVGPPITVRIACGVGVVGGVQTMGDLPHGGHAIGVLVVVKLEVGI
jgi:hypothetical protein